MLYESVTVWQANNYLVLVRTGVFTTQERANEFASQEMKLIRDGNRLVLLDNSGHQLDEAFDENTTVMLLKKGSQGQYIVSEQDYERVNITISEFELYSELCSFGSLAYGVNESTELELITPI